MPFDKFLIAPFRTGLQKDVKPWLIMNDAFQSIRNAYVWRGTLKKRVGSKLMNNQVDEAIQQLFSRLRINIGTTNGDGNRAGTVPGTVFKVGQMFSVGDEMMTVVQAGNNTMNTTGGDTSTFDTANGNFSIMNATPNTAIFFYPTEPVMGFLIFEQEAINVELTIAFDTQFAYQFTFATGWQRLDQEANPGNSVWTGGNANFFNGRNYRGINVSDNLLFVTNNVNTIRFFNGISMQWDELIPIIDANNSTVDTCLFVIPFKNRLVLFNTTETTQPAGTQRNFRARARYSGRLESPLAATTWREDLVGAGSFLDAPTSEAIVGVEYIKDRLIVYFERSTYEFVYLGNTIAPFDWQKINTDLGVESSKSVIPFDRNIIGFGANGIHACNGMNVQRIDDKIPDFIFEVRNENDGPQRVAGIQDFYNEIVYWAYPDTVESGNFQEEFPNQVLVFDYRNNTWAQNDDSITAFGYYQEEQNLTWADVSQTWQQLNIRWADPSFQSRFRSIIAGNQQGFTFLLNSDLSLNSFSLSIIDVQINNNFFEFTIIDHNLKVGDFIFVDNAQGDADLVDEINGEILQIDEVPSKDLIRIDIGSLVNPANEYNGGGVVSLVSRIEIQTKDLNFYNTVGNRILLQEIDFLVNNVPDGEFEVNVSLSTAASNIPTSAVAGVPMGSNIIETSQLVPIEFNLSQFWRSLFPLTQGDTFSIIIRYNDDQMFEPSIAFADFELNAMLFHVKQVNKFASFGG